MRRDCFFFGRSKHFGDFLFFFFFFVGYDYGRGLFVSFLFRSCLEFFYIFEIWDDTSFFFEIWEKFQFSKLKIPNFASNFGRSFKFFKFRTSNSINLKKKYIIHTNLIFYILFTFLRKDCFFFWTIEGFWGFFVFFFFPLWITIMEEVYLWVSFFDLGIFLHLWNLRGYFFFFWNLRKVSIFEVKNSKFCVKLWKEFQIF